MMVFIKYILCIYIITYIFSKSHDWRIFLSITKWLHTFNAGPSENLMWQADGSSAEWLNGYPKDAHGLIPYFLIPVTWKCVLLHGNKWALKI